MYWMVVPTSSTGSEMRRVECSTSPGSVQYITGEKRGCGVGPGGTEHIAQGRVGHSLFSQKGGSLLQLRSHWQVSVSLPTMS